MISVRKAACGDAADIQRLSRDDLGYDCEVSLVKERIAALDDRRECVFVAECDNKVVGYVHVEKYDLLYYESLANILGLAVDGEHRRKGIGKQLMSAAEGWGKEIGAKKVRLNSGGSRTGAHEFYRAVGYGEEKTQIRFMKKLG